MAIVPVLHHSPFSSESSTAFLFAYRLQCHPHHGDVHCALVMPAVNMSGMQFCSRWNTFTKLEETTKLSVLIRMYEMRVYSDYYFVSEPLRQARKNRTVYTHACLVYMYAIYSYACIHLLAEYSEIIYHRCMKMLCFIFSFNIHI